jgi:hydrogenase 3 maturation protease
VNSWKEFLSRALGQSRRPALVGVGQELRGDDAAGILAIRRLQQAIEPADDPDSEMITASSTRAESTADSKSPPLAPTRFFFEAGSLPEASAGPLRRFGPDWVIFLDAAEMGKAPGSISWIEPDQIDAITGSTHAFPMSGFFEYLKSELGCRVSLVGIQPKHMDFDAPVSDEILRAVNEIADFIIGENLKTVL